MKLILTSVLSFGSVVTQVSTSSWETSTRVQFSSSVGRGSSPRLVTHGCSWVLGRGYILSRLRLFRVGMCRVPKSYIKILGVKLMMVSNIPWNRSVILVNNNNGRLYCVGIRQVWRSWHMNIITPVIGPVISFSTPWGVCSPCCQMCNATSLITHNYHLYPQKVPIYTPGWREAIRVKVSCSGTK